VPSGSRSHHGALIAVLPTQAAAAQLADRLLDVPSGRIASRALWTRDVTTLRSLVERILLLHDAPRRRLDPIAREILIADLVHELDPEIRRLFGPGLDAPGATRAVGAAIAELRQADLTSLALREVAPGRRRLTALTAALLAYEERLERGRWWDEADLTREATALVRSRAWCPEGIDVLLVRGLYDVTPLQGELLRAVARRARRVRIELPFDPTNERPYAYAYPYLRAWERLDEPGLDIEIVYPEADDHGPRGTLLRRYRRPDETLDALALPLGGTVELLAASDPDEEVRCVADWVRACAGRGIRLEEIGVVVASPDYRAALRRELARHGIPWYSRREVQLSQTPLFAAILFPFRLLEDGMRREDLRAWATSPLTSTLDARAAAYALAHGPAGAATAAEWYRAFETERRAQDQLATVCLGIAALAKGEHSPAEFWSAYDRLLAAAGLTGRSEIEGWERWQHTLGALEGYLAALGRWHAPRQSWRAHRRLLLEALAGSSKGAGRPGRGITVLDPFDARGLSFRASAIVGLVEGTLGRSSAAHSILGDGEREALNSHFGSSPFTEELFRTSHRDPDEAALLLLERVLSTTDAVLLSYPVQDRDGTPLVPSLAWQDARRALGHPAPAEDVPPSPPRAWRIDVTSERVTALQRIEQGRTRFFGRDVEARRGKGGPFDGVFTPGSAREILREFDDGAFTHWSASKLEAWRSCPHRFFQGHVLGIRRIDESPLEAEFRTLGNLAHATLQRMATRTSSAAPPKRAEIQAVIDEAEIDIAPPERGDPRVWPILKRRVARELARYFRLIASGEPTPLVPEIFELEFGPPRRRRLEESSIDDAEGEDPARRPAGAKIPSITIETRHGPVELGGRIDRIDRNPLSGALHVIDYKYSPKRREHRRSVEPQWCGVDYFQLYVYFLGARLWAELAGLGEPSSVTGSVHCLRQPKDPIAGILTGPSSLEIETAVAGTVAQAGEGAYDPSPRSPATCGYCDFRRSCRIATVAGVPTPEEP
jgi:superfamily I DNA/RNA helicase